MKSRPTSVADLADRLMKHLVKHRMNRKVAARRVSEYYGLGCRGTH